jgi:thioesterase domain-containing protein
MTAHWGIADPAAAQGGAEQRNRAFFAAFSQLQNRILTFASLQLDKLDEDALQRHLDRIGEEEQESATSLADRLQWESRAQRLQSRHQRVVRARSTRQGLP